MEQVQRGIETVSLGAGLCHIIEQLHILSQRGFPSDEAKAVLGQVGLIRTELDPYIFYASNCYTRNRVYKSPAFELILMCWQPGQRSAVHGHEGQKCWMYVAEGALEFTNYRDTPEATGMSVQKVSTISGAQGFVDGPAYIHAVANVSNQAALSLHLYATPFSQCDAYDICAQTTKKVQLCYYSIDGKLVV